jgi:signal transduction histidine kinase
VSASGLMCRNACARIVHGMSDSGLTAAGIAGLRRQRARLEAVLRWHRRMTPVVLSGLAVLATLLNIQGPRPGLSGRGLAVLLALAGFVMGCLGVRGTVRRSRRGYAAFAVVLIASSCALIWAQPTGAGYAGAFIGVLLVATRLPWRAALGLPAAAMAVLAVIAYMARAGAAGQVAVMAGFGGFLGMMSLVGRLSDAAGEEECLLSELERRRAAAAHAAGLAERQRLAREMHDVLAHSLSGLMLQLEAARIMAAEDRGDRRLPGTIDRAHHLARTGLDEARRAIGTLRDDEMPGPERLAALAAQFEQDRGIPCSLAVTGSERVLGPQARLALYRVAQEALTNITKHARPDRVELRLRYQPDATRLVVEDFAATPVAQHVVADGDGYGLTGMRERAELLGGTLTATSTRTGFLVELKVPG